MELLTDKRNAGLSLPELRKSIGLLKLAENVSSIEFESLCQKLVTFKLNFRAIYDCSPKYGVTQKSTSVSQII